MLPRSVTAADDTITIHPEIPLTLNSDLFRAIHHDDQFSPSWHPVTLETVIRSLTPTPEQVAVQARDLRRFSHYRKR